MRYGDFIPMSLDQAYIDKLSDIYDVDYYDAEIDSNYRATNQLIEYILVEAVNKLELSEEAKDILNESIYCNSLDSGFNLTYEDLDNTDLINEEKEIIKKFLEN